MGSRKENFAKWGVVYSNVVLKKLKDQTPMSTALVIVLLIIAKHIKRNKVTAQITVRIFGHAMFDVISS
jgi:hypothetical protein